MHHYLLLDAARMESNLAKARSLNHSGQCLYRLKEGDDLAGVAPYLFAEHKGSEFSRWYAEKGWGQSWGVVALADMSFDAAYRHFRQFLMVKTEDRQELYFRFYDPRVLRIFLPTCDGIQLKEFFGHVKHFIVEDENPQFAHVLSLRNGALYTQKLAAAQILSEQLGYHGEQHAPHTATITQQRNNAQVGSSVVPAQQEITPAKKKYRFFSDD